ncbi:MAG: RNA 2',3'-cyclic phosphodiesterase [Alphaproteobacteria bacterium]|mgnify:CR=1 FL=1|nr:MAG: RNA 2',3'-cyclic phosphodiesterase [Alphaproteobacteria bacterium]
MRLFVALSLPDTIRRQIGALCSGLPGARWVPSENLHITLRFLGELSGGAMDDVDAALAGVSAPRFTLSLGGVGHFGGGRQLRSVWAGVAREPALMHLRDKVESAVVRAGIEPEGKKYQPHVTLTRPKGTPVPKLQEFLARHSLFRSEPWEVRHFSLYSSFLSHEAAIYREERRYALGGSWQAGDYGGDYDGEYDDAEDDLEAMAAEPDEPRRG